jgi:signal transduction histidine kinase/BarA-like signal transduction histidine kinase
MNILLVEDDSITRLAFEEDLRILGYEVTACADAETALEIYHKTYFPLILLDLSLPGMDGFEFARGIRALPQGVWSIILVITAFDEQQNLKTAMEAGANDYLIKPVNKEQLHVRLTILERHLENLLQRKQAEEELGRYHKHLEQLVGERTAELTRTNAELLRASRYKDEFLANMSHDLRTPLNAILGFTEILTDQLRDAPYCHDYLRGIMNSGRNLLSLINDVLDLSTIEAGHLEIRLEPVNLRALIKDIHSTFAMKAKEKRLVFEIQISPDTPTTAFLDSTRLRQILMNLVGNAIKFTDKGSVTLRVKNVDPVETGRRPVSTMTQLMFEVADTGIGISPDEQPHLFEPFHQGQRSRNLGGTGLGLSISKRLVELMNGSISFESEVNKGTIFRVLLPVSEVMTTEEELSEPSRDIRQIQFQGATILLVEDNEQNREVIRGFLAPHNLQIVETENGQEAIRILEHLRPDMILMDIHMPIMDGNQATQMIKANQELQTIPVVALTAYAMRAEQVQFQKLYEAYLSKPVSKSDLLTMLAQFLPHTNVTENGMGERPAFPETEWQPSILEALKVSARQVGLFPQEFCDQLRTDLLPKYQEVSELMSVDEIMAFAERLIMVGETFTILPVKQYGENLRRAIKVFDIITVKTLLALFPDMVELICRQEIEH